MGSSIDGKNSMDHGCGRGSGLFVSNQYLELDDER